METRKVQFTGNSTYTISLPKEWVRKMGVKTGDFLALSIGDSGILNVSPTIMEARRSRIKEFMIGKESPVHLERMLIGAYVMGFDTITVRAKERIDNSMKERIRHFTRSVTGVEIVEESINNIVIKDLSDPLELSQEKGVRRLHLIVKSMQEDAVGAFMNSDASLAVDVINRDYDADRLYWIIMKVHNMMMKNMMLSEKLRITVDESNSFFQIARYLERIGDHAVQIAKSVGELNEFQPGGEMKEKFANAHQIAIRMLDGAMNAFFRRNVEEANRVIDQRESLKDFLSELSRKIQKVKGEEAINLALIEESIRRTAYYSTDICEVSINYCMLP
ncbi:MAG: phosphate uptake regulator PhoU [Thermoplasmata archaeon]|jgi:phosphate uptake regulator|nr:phosphate uptake regulator PhoU [Candidatus Sysuiplasma jiujiangense]MBX8639470.1 phosphate uptake regulator PhoU [Candidatus Sysuiplasma jiujiangense]